MFDNLFSEDESQVLINYPDGSPMGIKDADGEFQQTVIIVRSPTNEAIRQHDLAQRRKRQAEAGKAPKKQKARVDVDELEASGRDKLMVIISGWENLPGEGGKPATFSDENKRKFVDAYKLDYVHRQILDHHWDEANFTPAYPSD